jgi:hypothetical protein
MRVAAYVNGSHLPIRGVANRDSVILEVTLDDSRTVQLDVRGDGVVQLRGWGNNPAKVGNWNTLNLTTQINKQEQTHCEVCYCPLNDGPETYRCMCNHRKENDGTNVN